VINLKEVQRKNQTYGIDQILIDAIRSMAFYEQIDKAEIVRQALYAHIPEKYINMAKEKQQMPT